MWVRLAFFCSGDLRCETKRNLAYLARARCLATCQARRVIRELVQAIMTTKRKSTYTCNLGSCIYARRSGLQVFVKLLVFL